MIVISHPPDRFKNQICSFKNLFNEPPAGAKKEQERLIPVSHKLSQMAKRDAPRMEMCSGRHELCRPAEAAVQVCQNFVKGRDYLDQFKGSLALGIVGGSPPLLPVSNNPLRKLLLPVNRCRHVITEQAERPS